MVERRIQRFRDSNAQTWWGLHLDRAKDTEMVLFGTGQTVMPVPKEMREYVSGLGIQLDVMDSVGYIARAELMGSETLRQPTTCCRKKAGGLRLLCAL